MKNSKNLIISIVIIILFLGIGVYFIKKSKPVEDNVEQPVVTNSDLKHFTSRDNTFEFDYPNDPAFTFGDSLKEGHAPTRLAEVDLHGIFMPNTNFSDASFDVSRLTEESVIRNCSAPTNGEEDKGTVTISGYPFKKFTLTDAGAGNFYETTDYRGIVDGDCYSIGYTIHSTNIGNYPPEAGRKEFDKDKIVSEFESIIKSFKFLINSD